MNMNGAGNNLCGKVIPEAPFNRTKLEIYFIDKALYSIALYTMDTAQSG